MKTRTLILHAELVEHGRPADDAQYRLEEAVGLAQAIALDVVGTEHIKLRKITPATYLGKGKAEELKARCAAKNIDVVIMNTSISPIQQRNLERALECKVIDRTALILEIFGERAQTKEGVLQVELAALEYAKSRLVRSWTHLERQRGGLGFVGGPGETQIEIDRRLIGQRIKKIKQQLEKVKKTRGLHRKSRQKVPYPIVALVGYTNAGKSTLFNRLTGAEVFVKDLLFATLDPTMRELKMPGRDKIILSDTVGFISNLPTELIAAFRATLEEVISADIIVHVRDITDPARDAHNEDVMGILADLGVDVRDEAHSISVWNKWDLASEEEQALARKADMCVSALTGEGCEALVELLKQRLNIH